MAVSTDGISVGGILKGAVLAGRSSAHKSLGQGHGFGVALRGMLLATYNRALLSFFDFRPLAAPFFRATPAATSGHSR